MTTTREQRRSVPSPIAHTSSPSASVFWLNLDQVRSCLKKATKRLADKYPEVEAVWLFGSLARGDAIPGSDADLFVLLTHTDHPFLDRSVRYQPAFCGIGVDVFAYTREEVTSMLSEGNPLLRQVRAERRCLFRRAGVSDPFLAGPEPTADSGAEIEKQ